MYTSHFEMQNEVIFSSPIKKIGVNYLVGAFNSEERRLKYQM